MQVKILSADKREIYLKNSFNVKEKVISHTISYQVAIDIDGEVINSCLCALPLFYPNQDITTYVNKSYFFDLKNLSFNESLEANVLFCFELAIIKYINLNRPAISTKLFKQFEKKPKALVNSLYISSGDFNPKVKTTKIKIGRHSIKEDNQTIKDLISQGLTLRLDGNRMLLPDTLLKILDGVDLEKIEYIEEPFSSVNDWESFKLKDRVALALDESLQEALKRSLPTNTGAFIIKPTLIFGLFKTIKLINSVKYSDIKKVISSSFDDEQTINTLIHIASFEDKNTAHGLATLDHLKLTPSLVYQDGRFLQGFPISSF